MNENSTENAVKKNVGGLKVDMSYCDTLKKVKSLLVVNHGQLFTCGAEQCTMSAFKRLINETSLSVGV